MKAKKIEYIEKENYGAELFINDEKYGFAISKIEIEDTNHIKVYSSKSLYNKKPEDYSEEFKDMKNPKELMKYENIILILE